MKPQDKQAYLEEYELLKKKGKPFFPYAVMKDSVMALIVVAVIIAMSIILGAEQGPKADPTSTTYVPRPEWYFFFLFELLRVIKPPELVPIATIGIPTICMVLLLLLPFYDRGPERRPERRPIATTAGFITIIAMGYLTYLGATGGSPTEIDMKVSAKYEPGKEVVAAVRLPRLPQAGRERQQRPGPRTDPHRLPDPPGCDHSLGRNRPGHHALLPRPAAAEDRTARGLPFVPRLARRSGRGRCPESHGHDQRQPPIAGLRRPGQPHVRPRRRPLRRAQLGDDRRPAPPLARARRGPDRARLRRLGSRHLLRDRRPGAGAGAAGHPWRPRRRLRLLRADARPGAGEGGGAEHRRSSASSGPTRWSFPTTASASTPSPSASGSATSPTSTAACARWPGC